MTASPAIPAIVKTVTVNVTPADAFEVFTAGVGQWWPLATYSVGGASSRVAFDTTAIVETLDDGTTSAWGEVSVWDPPRRVEFSWHPGREAGPQQTHIAVSFEPTDEGTLVRLEHSDWERTNPEIRAGYDSGWDEVLAGYAAATLTPG